MLHRFLNESLIQLQIKTKKEKFLNIIKNKKI